MGRNRKKFTEKEIGILASNPYTYRVTDTTIRFTLEFKDVFLDHAALVCRDGERFGALGMIGVIEKIRIEHEVVIGKVGVFVHVTFDFDIIAQDYKAGKIITAGKSICVNSRQCGREFDNVNVSTKILIIIID